jgi:hypothetical protein
VTERKDSSVEDIAVSEELAGLIGLPVRHRGITLGHVTDVLVDETTAAAAVGLVVLSVAGDPAFLPWPSADRRGDELDVRYPLALLSEVELDYYRTSTSSLARLLATRGEPAATG